MEQETALEELITYTIKIANRWPRVYIALKKKYLFSLYFNSNYMASIHFDFNI